jgi:hypothetical protein
MQVSIGLRAHSGWSALVVVAGSGGSVSVLDRRRIELADPRVPGFPQPFHAAEPLPLKQAEELVRRCIETSRRMAEDALRAAVDDLRKRKYVVAACGIVVGSGRPLPALASILASHALIHTAEGEMFREALLHAANRCSVAARTIRERGAYDLAAEALCIPVADIQERIAHLGRQLGPPWREDQKLATLAGWVALPHGDSAQRLDK